MSFGLRVREALSHSTLQLLNLCVPVMRKTATVINQRFKEYTAFSKTALFQSAVLYLAPPVTLQKTIPLFYQDICTW